MLNKRGLGRGLSDLGVSELISDLKAEKQTWRMLPIELLHPGRYQPRRDMDYAALQDLASSIRAQGIIQPIVVRPVQEGMYEIIAGERRWRAAQLAELQEVPVVVHDITDEAAIAVSLIENIQRENLNAVEEAIALQRLIDEFTMTHQEAADAVGRSRVAVTNLLRLLSLHEDVKTMLQHGDLEMGHARALLSLDADLQLETARTVVAKALSVRETERLIKNMRSPAATKKATASDPNIVSLQNELQDNLGARVTLQHAAPGHGKLIIHYNNLDELDGILQRIKK